LQTVLPRSAAKKAPARKMIATNLPELRKAKSFRREIVVATAANAFPQGTHGAVVNLAYRAEKCAIKGT